MPLRNIVADPPLPERVMDRLARRERRESRADRPYSVTQLLAPSEQMALRMRYDYDVSVHRLFSALRGTMLHQYFLGEPSEDALEIREMRLQYPAPPAIPLFYGHPDLYEKQNGVLSDFKYYGSWRILRLLEQSPEEFAQDEIWQLNAYRLMIEALGYPVRTMQMVVFSFDTNTKKYAKTDREYWIFPIDRIGDATVIEHFTERGRRLDAALSGLDTFEPLPACPPEERWDEDKRCKYWCPVAEHCEWGRQYREILR